MNELNASINADVEADLADAAELDEATRALADRMNARAAARRKKAEERTERLNAELTEASEREREALARKIDANELDTPSSSIKDRYTVAQLKTLAKDHGLKVSGNEDDLIARLIEAGVEL
ncbi:MAG: SAP domain-containing protein [Candidatus Neomicrothrix subdominans]